MKRILACAAVVLSLTIPALAGWDEGVDAFNRGEYAVAIEHLTKVLKRSPEYAPAHYLLGVCNLNLKNIDAALESLSRAVELDPDTPDYAVGLGHALLSDGQAERAWTTLEPIDASELEPQVRLSHALTLAAAAEQSGRPEHAVAVLEAAIADAPGQASLYSALGVAHYRLDHHLEAAEAWGQAFELDPRDITSGRNGVKVALDAAEAASTGADRSQLLELAVELATTLAETTAATEDLELAGKVCLASGKPEQAVQLLEPARTADPPNPSTLLLLARGLAMSGQVEPAIETLNKALTLEPESELRRRLHAWLARLAECRFDLAGAAYHHRQAGNDERATEIEELRSNSAAAVSRRDELLETISGLRAMLPELEQLGDDAGQEAVQQKIDEYQQQVSAIDVNLAEVRAVLEGSCPAG